jgi:glycosyltransferase involved in cell wall biosynthesis
MSLRLAVLIHDYCPRVGGAQALLRAQAPPLQELGADVTILTRRFPGTAPFELVDGIPVHRLPAPPPRLLASLAFTISSLAFLRRLRPDVIHANEFISPATVALLANRLLGTPIVVTPHRSGPIGDVSRLQQRSSGRARLGALRDQADAFVVISREIGDELRGIGVPPQKMRYINNGVDTCRFAPLNAASRQALRRTIGIAADALTVIFAGRLVREKRLDNLLTLWPSIRAACPRAELLLLGTGDQEADLRKSVSEGVRFLGRQGNVVSFLQAADIFVLPSSAEGLSIAMLEAMSCGLAPVVTRVGGSSEVIADGENGLLIRPDDVPALQNALIRLLRDADLRTRLGLGARRRIEESYSVEKSAKELFSLYTEVVSAAGHSSTRRGP